MDNQTGRPPNVPYTRFDNNSSELYPFPDFFTYLPQKEEIYHRYQDNGWSILEYKESVGHLHKQDSLGRQISGLFGVLLAQKIG